jgi:predicted alpha/beta-hydrolase family hydrolase
MLHQPAAPTGDGLVLTHGAGSNANAPLLVAIAEAFAAAGITVQRYDLPFRQKRPHGPPFPASAAQDRAGLESAVASLRTQLTGRIFLGGHSYGGRQATMLCSDNPTVAAGLLLLSYPLHPPQRPEDLRTAHFPKLTTAALFVQGTRDPFGSIEEMQAALELIPGRHMLVALDGAGHDLGGKAKAKSVAVTVLDAFRRFHPTGSKPDRETVGD